MESLTREGRLLAFVDTGSGAPPIVLIHDLGSDHRLLRRQFAHFRRKHRVVAVDLRDHGKAGRPPTRHTVAGLAEDLDWLCRELGLYRPAVLGQGVGGMIAVELAAHHPDLLSAVVAVDAKVLFGEATRDDRAEGAETQLHLTTSWGLAEDWDGARALALCKAPILLVETRRDIATAERIPALSPGMSVKVVQGSRLRPGQAAKQVNALIDAFLTGNEVSPCLQLG